MKSFTYTLILLYFYIFSSCKGDSSNSAPFDGVFVTESGIKFVKRRFNHTYPI